MTDFTAVATPIFYIHALKLGSQRHGNGHIYGEGTEPAADRGVPAKVSPESAVGRAEQTGSRA
jgi:hypothetical protein